MLLLMLLLLLLLLMMMMMMTVTVTMTMTMTIMLRNRSLDYTLCYSSETNQSCEEKQFLTQQWPDWPLLKVKRLKLCIALHAKPISELRGVSRVTCHMGSHSVTCHPTQVNAPRQPTRPVLDLPTPEGWKVELTSDL